MKSRWAWCLLVLIALLIASPFVALAASEHHGEAATSEAGIGEGIKRAGYGLGAGLALGLTGLATGIAQSKIGSAGIGALAENPKLIGNVILLVAIPETVVILGFVIAFMILGAP
ncbi:F0F1 ATP synthase subunit C [candidate division TA06 bacterium]|nr:F0F1 ATP synthase subunit C [candidate division TA06 bacterium]